MRRGSGRHSGPDAAGARADPSKGLRRVAARDVEQSERRAASGLASPGFPAGGGATAARPPPSEPFVQALVTGASAGIGVAFCERLAADGYDLVAVARRRGRLEELAARLEGEHGTRVEVLAADLADADGLAAVEERTAAGIDLLVNNAGFAGYRAFAELDPAVAEDLVRVHVLATTRLTRAAVPAIVERGGGAIVNVASLLAFSGSLPPDPLPQRATYGACKAYMVVFTQLLQQELASTGVRVQVLCPGLVRTEFHEVAGRDPGRLPYGMMEPGEVVRASLRGLELGEVVCAPGLEDLGLVGASDEAQRTLFRAAVAGRLAARYDERR